MRNEIFIRRALAAHVGIDNYLVDDVNQTDYTKKL